MPPSLDQLKKWIESHRAQAKEEYFHFLRFRSISADPAYRKEMISCAEWVCRFLAEKAKMKAEIVETETYPLVYAEDLQAGKGAPTLLIYGHYDVQPVDPLELWKSDPFEPTEREGKIFARGAVDDKGQIYYAMLAVRCWKDLGYKLPVNLKFCIEGEEESSSIGLSKALPKLKERLKSDYLLVPDFDQYDRHTPSITLGARGVMGLEVTLTGSKSDLHSGIHGGLAYNPNRALVQLLSQIWDEKGTVRIPGFYDDAVSVTSEQMKEFAFGFEQEKYTKEFGIEAFGWEKGKSPIEGNYFRPTLEINGISGGYAGPGLKTVIPAHASAKISCRLVPNQDPRKVGKLIADFFKKHAVAGMKVEVKLHGGEEAFRGKSDSELAKAVSLAAEEVTGKNCKKVLSGASIPIVAQLMKTAGAEVVGMGYGLAEDNIHAPNEHFDWERLEKGFLTVARTLELL